MKTESRTDSLGLCTLAVGACLAAHAAAPVITNITLFGANPRLSIQSEVGLINQIEYSTNLGLTSWTVLTNVEVAQSNYSLVDNIPPPAPQRFYRLVAFPPSTPEANGMVLIPAGSFTMGDTFNDGESDVPTHSVDVSTFYMGTNLITKSAWNQVYQWAINHGYSFDFVGAGKGSNHPVQTINWHDMVKWCNARSEREGQVPAYYTDAAQATPYRSGQVDLASAWVNWSAGYRLPTEAEWEKAARGGLSGKRFPWGDLITHTNANYFSSGAFPYDLSLTDGYDPTYDDGVSPYTSPVGSFPPNGYGLFDMAGNVEEWCWDRYDAAYYSSSPSTAPRGPATGADRVLRGGSYFNPALFARCAGRISSTSTPAYINVGFRCVRGL